MSDEPIESDTIHYFTKEERRALRAASFEYEGFGDDTESGFKFPALIATTLDAGLRPGEVREANVGWLGTINEHGVLEIPDDDLPRHEPDWSVMMKDSTYHLIERWLDERASMRQYTDTEALWLTQSGERYEEEHLDGHLQHLCDQAGIDLDGRPRSWWLLHHSTAVGLAPLMEQGQFRNHLRYRPPKHQRYAEFATWDEGIQQALEEI